MPGSELTYTVYSRRRAAETRHLGNGNELTVQGSDVDMVKDSADGRWYGCLRCRWVSGGGDWRAPDAIGLMAHALWHRDVRGEAVPDGALAKLALDVLREAGWREGEPWPG
jgi:hypothetical protein